MPLVLLVVHVRHVANPLIQTCKTKTSTTFCSHFFKGNIRSFLNSLHLHLWVQHLEEKNSFIPLQGFNHFFHPSDSSSTSSQEPKARNKKWSYGSQRKAFIIAILLRITISSAKYPSIDFSKSADPSADCSQQNLLNFNAECLFAEYFVAESFRSQSANPSADCS